LNIYVALLLGLLFIVLYSVTCTFFYNLNYRRINKGNNMNKKQIYINLLVHGFIGLVYVTVVIYFSYFK